MKTPPGRTIFVHVFRQACSAKTRRVVYLVHQQVFETKKGEPGDARTRVSSPNVQNRSSFSDILTNEILDPRVPLVPFKRLRIPARHDGQWCDTYGAHGATRYSAI